MILGIGTDIIEVDRIANAMERYGSQFLNKIFTAAERAYCDAHPNVAERYAVRFAAKEAFSKAIGTGWTGQFEWQHVAVARQADGKPYLLLDGELARRWNPHHIHVSLSHTHRYATATVIIEARDLPAEA